MRIAMKMGLRESRIIENSSKTAEEGEKFFAAKERKMELNRMPCVKTGQRTVKKSP